MSDITQLPCQLDRAKRQCRAIIEAPKGRRIKFKYEKDSGLFSISKMLPQDFSFLFKKWTSTRSTSVAARSAKK